MAVESDRNLLFGILGWQNGLITQGQLLTAMKAWAFEKSEPLGEILVREEAITAEQRELLEPMVDAQIKLHGGNPQQSLIAVSLATPVANALRSLGDPGLQASLGHLVSDKLSDPSATMVASIGQASREGRFQILRPHARGGLGEVFVARDTELNREVALKQIQARHAFDENSQNRFVLEAEITGGLEHPGIVPVYGLGSYKDGRPYYAMRLIRGMNLGTAIADYHNTAGTDAEKNVEFRGLLQRFIDVCDAVAYAHSRGVLHRDLKPGNIMLGKYGETLVVDWGLAKAVGVDDQPTDETVPKPTGEGALAPLSGSSVDHTIAGEAMGTPAYMSPEQAVGRLEELGPATDVYAMGATLYQILTGQAPHGGKDLGKVLQDIATGRFPKPREVDSGINKSLEAVCLRAMATKPTSRYGTVHELAADVERFLADEPVRDGRTAHRKCPPMD